MFLELFLNKLENYYLYNNPCEHRFLAVKS